MSNRIFDSSSITRRLRDQNVAQAYYRQNQNAQPLILNPQNGHVSAEILGQYRTGAATTFQKTLQGATTYDVGGIGNYVTTYPPFKAIPSQIIFLRHGEKPAGGPYINDLTPQGCARAQALITYLGTPGSSLYKKPNVVYAQICSNWASCSGDTACCVDSARPIETITPYCQSQGITPILDYTIDAYPGAITNMLGNHAANNNTVAFCWEHTTIPPFAEAMFPDIGALSWNLDPYSGAPDNEDLYDVMWVFNLIDPSTQKYKFNVLYQVQINPGTPPNSAPGPLGSLIGAYNFPSCVGCSNIYCTVTPSTTYNCYYPSNTGASFLEYDGPVVTLV
jgi:hypothetical protein